MKHWWLSFGSGTKLFITFLSLRFLDMRRERYNFFLCWLFHLTPTTCGPHCKLLVWPRRALKVNSRLEFKLQLLFFFQIPKILSTSRHDVIHVPGPISYLGFLLWHLWLSHPPRVWVSTCAQCVHLTNPCTKRKVLSLTKQKDKKSKTKNDNIKKNPSAII